MTQADDVEQGGTTATALDTRSAVTSIGAATAKPGAPAPERSRSRLRIPRADLLIGLGYLALAVTVLSGQWRNTGSGYLIKSGQDQTMWEWFFAVTAHSVANLENPLGTTLQNFPAGVNMMANTAMFGVGVPLTPVTLLFGPTVTFVLVLTVGLAGTAFAWYRLFARELAESRAAAVIGGLFCGFAPAMISHASAHPNFVALFLLPVIAGLLIRMVRDADRPHLRDAVVLALLVAAQIALGEEPLLIFALAFAVFAVAYYLRDRQHGRNMLRRIAPTVGLGAVITLLLTGIPLWWQFFGSQGYRSIDHGPMGNDLKTLTQFPSESLGGLLSPGENVAINPTEQNAYFGWPLLLLVAAAAGLLWRDRVVRAATVVIGVFTVLSLGSELTIGEDETGIPLPWALLEQVPLVNSVLETRLTMAAVPAVAVILTLASDRAIHHWRAAAADWRPLAWFAALACALVPLTPTVLPVTERPATPDFFADNTVARYVDDGSVLVVPPPRPPDARALRWQSEAGFTFPLAEGYFVGPTADKKGMYGPQPRKTTGLLVRAVDTGRVPRIDAADRAAALADLHYWRADVVVLPRTGTEYAGVLHETMSRLLNARPVPVDDVWVWDVRWVR